MFEGKLNYITGIRNEYLKYENIYPSLSITFSFPNTYGVIVKVVPHTVDLSETQNSSSLFFKVAVTKYSKIIIEDEPLRAKLGFSPKKTWEYKTPEEVDELLENVCKLSPA